MIKKTTIIAIAIVLLSSYSHASKQDSVISPILALLLKGKVTMEKGIVIDSHIIGLRYISINSNHSEKIEKITNQKGEFQYFKDGTTSFYVGNIKVAELKSKKFIAITTTAETETESTNIARFFQTIDYDSNPKNGIQISGSLDQNARHYTSSDLQFNDNFDNNFNSIKGKLFQDTIEIPETVTINNALEHSSKSEFLSSMKEYDLYKAIANEKSYGSGHYYNANILKNDQRKRVYLWIWENLLAKEMAIEDELQFTHPKYDLNNVEETRNQIKKYLNYAEDVANVASLGKATHKYLKRAGNRTMSYNIAKLSSLTVDGCDAVVNLYNETNGETENISDDSLCVNMMKILNPAGDPASKLAVANPILSKFLPQLLPKLVHAQKMNWLHFNTKSVRTISRMKVTKPDVASIALAIFSIANDFYGASWASSINEEMTTRMVAREWLSLWYRSGFKTEYMNKQINSKLGNTGDSTKQIEAIAVKLGNSGALCDTIQFFNPFYSCSGIKDINYDFGKVRDIINKKLYKANAIYTNTVELTGSLSNEEAEIGTVEIDWVDDTDIDPSLNQPPSISLIDRIDNDNFTESEFKIKVSDDYSKLYGMKCDVVYEEGSGTWTLAEIMGCPGSIGPGFNLCPGLIEGGNQKDGTVGINLSSCLPVNTSGSIKLRFCDDVVCSDWLESNYSFAANAAYPCNQNPPPPPPQDDE